MSAPYELEITGPARRQLQRLPTRIAVALVEFLTAVLIENPARMSKPLRGDLEGFRGARRGEYRVIFLLDESTRSISIVRIAHRSDVYRPR